MDAFVRHPFHVYGHYICMFILIYENAGRAGAYSVIDAAAESGF
jgi:hypothetical protein